MSDTLAGTVSALRRSGETLTEAVGRLDRVDPGPQPFGAGAPGRLGDLGRELYEQWQRALDARGREAAAHSARLHEVAAGVADAAGAYADADDSAHRRPEVT